MPSYNFGLVHKLLVHSPFNDDYLSLLRENRSSSTDLDREVRNNLQHWSTDDQLNIWAGDSNGNYGLKKALGSKEVEKGTSPKGDRGLETKEILKETKKVDVRKEVKRGDGLKRDRVSTRNDHPKGVTRGDGWKGVNQGVGQKRDHGPKRGNGPKGGHHLEMVQCNAKSRPFMTG